MKLKDKSNDNIQDDINKALGLSPQNSELMDKKTAISAAKGFLDGYFFDGRVHIPRLAKDIVVYGEANLDSVLDAHDITYEELAQIIEMPVFKQELKTTRELVETSPTAIIHLKAREVLEDALISIQASLNNPETSLGDKVKAAQLMSKLAKAEPEDVIQQGVTGGVILNLNAGATSMSDLLPKKHDGKPLREVKDVEVADA